MGNSPASGLSPVDIPEKAEEGPSGLSAVFLDRDGVLNEEVGYLNAAEQLRLLPGVAKALRRLNQQGIPVIVVSNQSAVGRGWCSEQKLSEIHDALQGLLAMDGAHIDHFYYCPHHPVEAMDPYRVDCSCRKPKPGMLLQAAQEHRLDLQRCVVIGDKGSDLEAGWQAKCQTVLVLTGYGRATQQLVGGHRFPDHVAHDLETAVDWVLRQLSRTGSP